MSDPENISENPDDAESLDREAMSPQTVDPQYPFSPENWGIRAGDVRVLARISQSAYQRMLLLLRAGAWDYVAAQSIRVTPDTYYAWIARGRAKPKRRKDLPYRRFFLDVMQARAEARITAEIQVKRDNPLAWLRTGPGRERPGEPGWTDNSKLTIEGGEHPIQVSVPEGVETDPVKTLANAFSTLERLGLIQRTAYGDGLFSSQLTRESDDGESIDVEHTDPSPNGNGKANGQQS